MGEFNGHPPHDQTTVTLPTGEAIEVDTGMVGLLALLWAAGVRTTYSCEGHEDQPYASSYVMFESRQHQRAGVRLWRRLLIEHGHLGPWNRTWLKACTHRPSSTISGVMVAGVLPALGERRWSSSQGYHGQWSIHMYYEDMALLRELSAARTAGRAPNLLPG